MESLQEAQTCCGSLKSVRTSVWFQINKKLVNGIWFWFDLIKFLCVYTIVSTHAEETALQKTCLNISLQLLVNLHICYRGATDEGNAPPISEHKLIYKRFVFEAYISSRFINIHPCLTGKITSIRRIAIWEIRRLSASRGPTEGLPETPWTITALSYWWVLGGPHYTDIRESLGQPMRVFPVWAGKFGVFSICCSEQFWTLLVIAVNGISLLLPLNSSIFPFRFLLSLMCTRVRGNHYRF